MIVKGQLLRKQSSRLFTLLAGLVKDCILHSIFLSTFCFAWHPQYNNFKPLHFKQITTKQEYNASGFVFAFHPAVMGSNSKHTLYAFSIYSLYSVLYLSLCWEKGKNNQKETGFGPHLKKLGIEFQRNRLLQQSFGHGFEFPASSISVIFSISNV